MWLKTRIGLCSVIEPFEIRVAKYPEDKKPSYLVFARALHDTDVQYKGIFGNLTAPGRYIYLARFKLLDASEAEIAQCMTLIEEAIANEARICDLSSVGHADAWSDASKEWYQIKW